jgi:transcriptional regulator with XRE-family HTH domain
MKTIGSRIKELRASMSQNEFSELVGINVNTLRNYERSARTPKIDILVSICEATKAELTWLVYGTGQMLRTKNDSKISSSDEYQSVQSHDDGAGSTQSTPTSSPNSANKIKELQREIGDLRIHLWERINDPGRFLVVDTIILEGSSNEVWEKINPRLTYSAGPVDIHKNKGFGVIVAGKSMVHAGIEPDMTLYCDPSLDIQDNDLVYVEDNEKRATIKYFKGSGKKAGESTVILQEQKDINNDDQQDEPLLIIPVSKINRMAVVSYIKRMP